MFNIIGLVSAVATFMGVWIGHVAVRRIEFNVPRLLPPILTTLMLGLCAESVSLLAADRAVSAAFGIFGITLIWDAVEFVRQERRVRRGRAPANPANPRHERILKECPAATTINWLKREPRRAAYSAAELESIVQEDK